MRRTPYPFKNPIYYSPPARPGARRFCEFLSPCIRFFKRFFLLQSRAGCATIAPDHSMEKEAADMRENYGILFEKTREEVRRSGTRPRLLLHACCAPCSSHCLEEVARDFDVTMFF
ncbi:MAG: epoxyqueuosine reductase QueH, partial [Clostridia bacterium]|nr:epoxyqueuosine reductase QueH [Clostridia bacterium]